MKRFSVRKFVVYFVVPLAITAPLVGLYFSGNETLQKIVSPEMPLMHPDSGREFGLLENIQNVLLLAMIGIAGAAAIRKKLPLEKAAFAFIALFAVFVFLEEIDYGRHWYEYAKGITWQDAAQVRNLHNQGDVTKITKQVVDIGMVLMFIVVPWTLGRSKNPILRYLAPDRYSGLTLIASFLIRSVAHSLKDQGVGSPGSIDRNLSEFREVATYYVFMLYLIEVGLRRTLASFSGASAEIAERN